jgi:D-alanine-D-alanine ligase
MQKKIKVAVLMGGKSEEHVVSLLSGRNVVASLNEKKYEVLPIVISKDGKRWQLTTRSLFLSLTNSLSPSGTANIILSKKTELNGREALNKKGVDIVFIALHGSCGEDGTVQGMLELAGISYSGSGVLASALGMDKTAFRKIMRVEGLPIPKYISVKRGENFKNIRKSLGRPPYFVKPFDQGSSVGASIVKKDKDLGKALKLAHQYSDTALVDEYIRGKEVTCAVLGNAKPIALPVVEIVPKNEFFDYESKYTESGAEEIVPARINKRVTKKVQDLAVQVYKSLGCRGFGRVDFIIKDNAVPIILEVNTIPGLTPVSLLPKAARAAGISYSNLLTRILNYAVEK